ncbi:MAG: IPTL-CTERM sorting domain-containing protein [Pseudomonadota bacterium]
MAHENTGKTGSSEKSVFNKRLMQYTLAAGAALALASPQDTGAAVQYSGVKNIAFTIGGSAFIEMDDFSGGAPANPDFEFRNVEFPSFIFSNRQSNVVSGVAAGAEIRVGSLESTNFKYPALPFVASNSVGAVSGTSSNDGFSTSAYLNFRSGPTGSVRRGNFLGTPGYIGVRFTIGAETHYGWIYLQSTADATSTTIIDWAYEDQPDTPIHVGTRSSDIPTLNEWGILILVGLILAEGTRRLRRKKDSDLPGPLGSA